MGAEIAGGCFIKPLRNIIGESLATYTLSSGEVSYIDTMTLLNNFVPSIINSKLTALGLDTVRIGSAGQGANALAVGIGAGKTAQGTNTVAIGYNAGNATQGATAIAIGVNAGSAGQGASAIAIGANAATTSQPANSIVINATGTIMGAEIAGGCFIKPVRNIIGESLAMYTLSSGEVSYIDTSTLMNMFVPSIVNSKIIAMGLDVVRIGSIGQGVNAVAVGINAGFTGQGANSIGIGKDAAMISQGANSMAIGLSAGRTAQGANAIAIGNFAGENAQAANAIAIGCLAGNNIQPARSIIINASGTELNITATDTDGCFIKPIKERLATTSVLMYNTLNSEITSCSVASIQSIANMNYAFASYTSGASQISNTAPSIVIFGGAYVHDAITVGGIATLTYSGGVFSFTHKCVVSISYSLQSPTDAILTAYLTTTTPIYSKLAGCTMPVICNGTHTLQMEAGGTVVLKIQSNTSVTNIEANISFLFHKIMR